MNSNFASRSTLEESHPLSSDNVLTVSGSLDSQRAQTELHLPGGQVVRIPTLLLTQPSTSASGFDSLAQADLRTVDDKIVIPVIEEHLQIGKRTVATGKILLEKQVQEFQQTLDVPLAVRTFDVERVVLNHPIDGPPPVRQEGDTTIYPVVEEQLILTTQLILKEEVRVTRRDTERRDTRTVTLQRESVTVTRSTAHDDQ